jgi:broad specificity phosphatase PhoE
MIVVKYYIVRHGQSEFNAGLTDRFNSEVTIKGLDQASKAGEYLAKEITNPQDYVGYVSPYTRCLQTALAIHYRTGIDFVPMGELGESPEDIHGRDKSQNLSVWNMSGHFPTFDWTEFGFQYDYHENRETYLSRLDRMIETMNATGKNLIVVSHATPIADLIRKICFDGRNEPMTIANCSITLIEDGKPVYIGKTV